jgi:ACS family hexuronate transporter-like MFS transporter
MGGAFGGIVMGQLAGWALDHGFGYAPVLATAASLHLVAFALICLAVPRIVRLDFRSGSRGVLS